MNTQNTDTERACPKCGEPQVLRQYAALRFEKPKPTWLHVLPLPTRDPRFCAFRLKRDGEAAS